MKNNLDPFEGMEGNPIAELKEIKEMFLSIPRDLHALWLKAGVYMLVPVITIGFFVYLIVNALNK